MIIITGAAGFIGSNLAKKLNDIGRNDLILVDDINHPLKKDNIDQIKHHELIGINDFLSWIKKSKNQKISSVFHLGACSDTLERNYKYLTQNNVVYSQKIWQYCIEADAEFIYASSAATYGDGMNGFSDRHDLITNLKPLNEYGQSKQDFDEWALSQNNAPNFWAGLKYFNVYGPGEAHKGRMASVVCHFLDQLKTSSEIKLFDSSHGVGPGEQKRDFVYIDDAIDMTLFMMNKKFKSGIYNIGSGTTSTFNELAEIFLEEKLAKAIKYIPFPKDLILNYQAYTCADMDKLRSVGYNIESTSLASGIKSYINQK